MVAWTCLSVTLYVRCLSWGSVRPHPLLSAYVIVQTCTLSLCQLVWMQKRMEANECIEWSHVVGEGTLTLLLGVCHSIITLKYVLPFQLCTMMEKKQAKDITLQMCFTWVTVVGCGMMTAWWRRYRRVMSYAHEYLAFRTYCIIAAATQSGVSLPVTKLDKLCVCVCAHTFVAEC